MNSGLTRKIPISRLAGRGYPWRVASLHCPLRFPLRERADLNRYTFGLTDRCSACELLSRFARLSGLSGFLISLGISARFPGPSQFSLLFARLSGLSGFGL